MNDAERIAAALKRLQVAKRQSYGWRVPPLDVLDCVLSLNRPYYSFVVPRVTRFRDAHPALTTLSGLRRLIRRYPSLLSFSVTELRVPRFRPRRHTARRRRLSSRRGVAVPRGRTERARLSAWAKSVTPANYEGFGVRGFGLAGFQYLRMLFGVQTTKPDVHIKRFVGNLVRRRVSDVEAIALLEAAARIARVPLRDADNAIWREVARHPPRGV